MVHERSATVDGHVTRYLEAGRGRPLILLHAFPLSADMWQSQLDRVPDGWRFIAPDLRGFGAGGDVPPSLTVDDYAGDVLGLMDGLGIETAVIGGLSMGGYVTFALFRRAPERFDGVILADTKAQADTADGRAGRLAMSEMLRTRGVGAVVDGLLPKLVGETTSRERPEVLADTRQLMEANRPGAIGAALHALDDPAGLDARSRSRRLPDARHRRAGRYRDPCRRRRAPRALHSGHRTGRAAARRPPLEPRGAGDFSSALTRFLSRAF